MKIMNCPQCGGTLCLTQYPGVYHCRYCRTLVESDVAALQEIELRKQQLKLQELALMDAKAAKLKKQRKVLHWQKFCCFWWGFIALTFVLGAFAAFFPTALSQTISVILQNCLLLRSFSSLLVACVRPDQCYESYSPPACSKSVLLFLFWFADMFQWVFVVLAA